MGDEALSVKKVFQLFCTFLLLPEFSRNVEVEFFS